MATLLSQNLGPPSSQTASHPLLEIGWLPLHNSYECPQLISSLAMQQAIIHCNDTDTSYELDSVLGHQTGSRGIELSCKWDLWEVIATVHFAGRVGWVVIFIVSFYSLVGAIHFEENNIKWALVWSYTELYLSLNL